MSLSMINILRDWQKKASERRDAEAEVSEIVNGVFYPKWYAKHFKAGYSFRDAEIDLLIQIIEKQSEALALYQNARQIISQDIARTTQAEVQQIIERLIE
jgi:hypothetical protein